MRAVARLIAGLSSPLSGKSARVSTFSNLYPSNPFLVSHVGGWAGEVTGVMWVIRGTVVRGGVYPSRAFNSATSTIFVWPGAARNYHPVSIVVRPVRFTEGKGPVVKVVGHGCRFTLADFFFRTDAVPVGTGGVVGVPTPAVVQGLRGTILANKV